jgi:MinD-like ATPase involved in chromosome partitioning or flagellar assembly
MSEIITFYSYKGGVGRTMALANVSVVLAKWGHRVLVVDWDLEAPGLEHFYQGFIEDVKLLETKQGVVDLLQLDTQINWRDGIIEISIPQSDVPIHLISSGKRDEDYFRKVREFNVDKFYEKDGGDIIEQLRNEWLDNYDYILIDSRTGITEIGGICTIQLPDTVVMLFTATNQGFDGILDIIQRASAAQQKLSYDRQKLIFLPIPSKFETNTEFKLSQEWLEIFAARLETTYNDWLPTTVDRKDFLELTKIPYIAYFSFGEKLPVIEQGVKDPTGLGYAYETLAVLIANHLNKVDLLLNNREQYIAEVNKNPFLEIDIRKNGNGNSVERRLRLLKQKLNVGDQVIKLEKSKGVIIECIEDSIFPLLVLISNEMKKFGTLFKNKNEEIEVIAEYGPYSNVQRSITTLALTSLVKEVKNEYSKMNSGFDLISLNYSCNFRNLRKSTNNEHLYINLYFEFHDSLFEMQSNNVSINFEKLYDEVINHEESESIVQGLSAYLIEQIEFFTK